MEYPEAFKKEMVHKMLGPRARATRELALETGVHQTTLSRWKREAVKLDDMSKRKIKSKARRPDDRTADEKLQLVLEASLLTEEELGEFLRRNGVREADLERWRQDALSGLTQKKEMPAQSKELRELKRAVQKRDKEIHRKDKALAEAAALLVLQKKVRAIWGDVDDDTEPRSGK